MKLPVAMSHGLSTLLAVALLSSCGAEPRLDLLGDPAPPAAATSTIVIHPDTRYVHVTGGDIVRFVVGDKSFAWHFDGSINVWAFRLNRIAPPGLLDHEVTAEIAPDPRYIGGGDGKMM